MPFVAVVAVVAVQQNDDHFQCKFLLIKVQFIQSTNHQHMGKIARLRTAIYVNICILCGCKCTTDDITVSYKIQMDKISLGFLFLFFYGEFLSHL